MKKFFILTTVFCLMVLGTVVPVFADSAISGGSSQSTVSNGSGGCPNSSTQLCNPAKATSVQALVANVLDIVVKIGSVFLVLAFIWVGFLFVKARGNPGEIESARHAFYWTVVGGLVLLGANVIANILVGTVSSLTQ